MPAESESTITILDCSGVGSGGITRVLTEVVRHWPAGHRLEVVAAPEAWHPPAGSAAAVEIRGRQVGGRARTVAAATAALRRATAGRDASVRVLSMSPSLAVVGSRLPVTTVMHDLAFRLWPREPSSAVRLYRRVSYATAIRRSARLVCVSARTRHDLYGVYGVAPERTAVWHLGSDLDTTPGEVPAELRAAGPYLVVAGHAAHKGVELAVAALPGLPGRSLAVLTGGRPVPQWAAVAQRHGVADRVVFLPRVDDAAYCAVVAGAEAFLMPSHFEGYGLPAVEALRLGTPTVVSPDPALLEATAGAAVRMTSWTADALVDAVAAATASRGGSTPELRSWRQATAQLLALLDGPAAARLPRQRRPADLSVADHS